MALRHVNWSILCREAGREEWAKEGKKVFYSPNSGDRTEGRGAEISENERTEGFLSDLRDRLVTMGGGKRKVGARKNNKENLGRGKAKTGLEGGKKKLHETIQFKMKEKKRS